MGDAPSLPPEVKAEIAVSFNEVHEKVDAHRRKTSEEIAAVSKGTAALRADMDNRLSKIDDKLDKLTEHIIDGEKTNRKQQESISEATVIANRAEAEVKTVARKAGGGVAAGVAVAVEVLSRVVEWAQGK